MIDLTKLTPYGRKCWAYRKYKEYEDGSIFKAIERSKKVYENPTDDAFKDRIDRSKWKSTVDKKVNYLLARKPVCTGYQDRLDKLADFIKLSLRKYILQGSLVWLVQGDGEGIEPEPYIMENTIAVYGDENREEPVAFIRKYTDIVLDEMTGAENEIVYYECYYGEGFSTRDTYCYTDDNHDRVGEVVSPYFIELGKTGDAPLFAYVERLIDAFDNVYKHQDKTVVKNTKPLVEVRGYTGTSEEDLEYAVETMSIAKTDGNGGVTIHTRSMDSTSIDLWVKRLMNEYYEATCTVGKDNELLYAQSGKAMDRLFIDMENDARDEAHVLEQALKEYFSRIGIEGIDIIWNTDRPVDDTSIIAGIQASTGILSKKTLLEQHPWVDDVDEELRRQQEESLEGMEDLNDDNDFNDGLNEF